jgi:hypothetical protein
MLRSILAVIVSVIGWFVVATIGNWILRLAVPGYSAVEVSMNFTLTMMICRLLLGLASSLGAGFVCAKVSRNSVAEGRYHFTSCNAEGGSFRWIYQTAWMNLPERNLRSSRLGIR